MFCVLTSVLKLPVAKLAVDAVNPATEKPPVMFGLEADGN